MREYKVIDSAASAEQLRRRLKNEELEQYGEPFTPEFVYEAIRKLPRFASMRVSDRPDGDGRPPSANVHIAGPSTRC